MVRVLAPFRRGLLLNRPWTSKHLYIKRMHLWLQLLDHELPQLFHHCVMQYFLQQLQQQDLAPTYHLVLLQQHEHP